MTHESYGRYKNLRPIGQGGMATVYLADDPVLRRVVAIKVLRNDLGTQSDWVRRFRDEATAIARLGSPNVVQVHDFGQEAEEDYLVMEFVQGTTLSELLREKGGRLDPTTAAAIVAQTAEGLRSAHEAAIIHRDVKPDNIMIRRDGTVKIADFGIARILEEVSKTRTGSMFGSPLFMAPEQIDGRNPSGAIDVFALGGVLFHALSGRYPFEAEHAHAILWKIVQEEAPNLGSILPGAPRELVELVAAMHRRDPSARPRAGDVARSLREFLGSHGNHDPVAAACRTLPDRIVSAAPVLLSLDAAPSEPVAKPPRAFFRRHPRAIPLAVSGAALILASFLAGKAWDRMQQETIPAPSKVDFPPANPGPTRPPAPEPIPELAHHTPVGGREVPVPAERNREPVRPPAPPAAAASTEITPSMRDESPSEKNIIKPRLALANSGTRRIHGIRWTWTFEHPAGQNPVLEVWDAPKCAIHLENQATRSVVAGDCSGLDLAPGQTWPNSNGLGFGLHFADWRPWPGKSAVLGGRMSVDPRIRTEAR